MKVIIFGSNGMLGSYLLKVLSCTYNVIPLTRRELDLASVCSQNIYTYISDMVSSKDVLINAAGVIKQRDHNILDMIKVNSIFPNILADIKTKVGCNIIHITTDCVFNGRDGNYTESNLHDCTDDYGKSKSLGENVINSNIRTSIIGREQYNKKSLLEWLLSNKKKTINGYVNHLWNGVTCLELAQQINQIIENNNYWCGTRHMFSPNTVSKFELSNIINRIYNLEMGVIPYNTPSHCYRNLNTIHNNPITSTLEHQIEELKNFIL